MRGYLLTAKESFDVMPWTMPFAAEGSFTLVWITLASPGCGSVLFLNLRTASGVLRDGGLGGRKASLAPGPGSNTLPACAKAV